MFLVASSTFPWAEIRRSVSESQLFRVRVFPDRWRKRASPRRCKLPGVLILLLPPQHVSLSNPALGRLVKCVCMCVCACRPLQWDSNAMETKKGVEVWTLLGKSFPTATVACDTWRRQQELGVNFAMRRGRLKKSGKITLEMESKVQEIGTILMVMIVHIALANYSDDDDPMTP